MSTLYITNDEDGDCIDDFNEAQDFMCFLAGVDFMTWRVVTKEELLALFD